MRAFSKFSWIPSLMVIVGLVALSSCKDDEKPKSTPGFAEAESQALENDGTIDITITLDRPASETVVFSYTLSGTADKLTSDGGDYDIVPDGGLIAIPKGASEATIEIELLEDGEFEYDLEEDIGYETVVITINEVVAGPVKLGEENLVHTLYIYEDDMLVFLDWDQSGGTEVEDMDLFFWYDDPDDSPDDGFSIVDGSTTPGDDAEAVLLIGGYPNAEYGFSCVYYSGDSDDLDFAITYFNTGGSVNGEDPGQAVQFLGNYSLDNINVWDEPGAEDPQIIQIAEKDGLDYDVSGLTEPSSGSRQRILRGNFGDTEKSTFRGVKKITLPNTFLERFKR